MALEAGKMGCTVHTLTLSIEQKTMADRRITAAGLSDSIQVHLLDYRDLASTFPEFEHSFDAFVASEMIEHVGEKHHAEFFRTLDWALKTENAGICITATSAPEHLYSLYQGGDFIRRYQWPGTFVPSATSLAKAVQAAVPGKFVLQSIVYLSPYYPRTLRE